MAQQEEEILTPEEAAEEHELRMRRAFNKGSDARINGFSLALSPYEAGTPEDFNWRYGWTDVHRHWGAYAKHPVPPLPFVPFVIVDRRMSHVSAH